VARTSRSAAAAALLLLGQSFLLGAGLVGGGVLVGVVPQAQAAPVAKGWTPYGSGGLLVQLPGGGQVRLVMPSGRPSPSDPPSDPSQDPPTDPASTQAADSAAPTPAVTPAPSQSAGGGTGGSAAPTRAPSAGPSVAVSDLPIPVLDPIYPGPARLPSVDSGTADAAAGAPGGAPTGGLPDGSSPTVPGGQTGGQDWLPLGAGPPPLGPQSLAAPPPLAGPAAIPLAEAAPGSGTGTIGPQAARWAQKKRLLPLGVGLALIGSGAALFGWRLRRP
jgi:hypothetical protein